MNVSETSRKRSDDVAVTVMSRNRYVTKRNERVHVFMSSWFCAYSSATHEPMNPGRFR